VFSVTALPPSLEEDQAQRMRRYLVSMGIRTACFILAVVALAVLHWTVIGWTFVVGAAILPYIAVVMANAARSPQSTTQGPVAPDNDTRPQISPRRPDEEPPR
jgi:Flp pilus assembly protein TadB